MTHLPNFRPQIEQRKPFRLGRALFLVLAGVRGVLLWIISACLLAACAIVSWRLLYLAWKSSAWAREWIDRTL